MADATFNKGGKSKKSKYRKTELIAEIDKTTFENKINKTYLSFKK